MALRQGSLDAQITQAPLPADVVRSVLRQALISLARLKKNGQVHGDIRPANLHAGADGTIRLAEPTDGAGDTNTIGTIAARPQVSAKYVAPEKLKADFGPAGPASDLYCLGFTALELL